MIEKIDVSGIVVDHFRTLRSFRDKTYSKSDFFVFLFMPLLAAGLFCWRKPELGADLVGVLATALSVFAALLFNLILLLYDMLSRASGTSARLSPKVVLLREVYSNVSFCILVAMVTLVILVAHFFGLKRHWFQWAVAYAVYSLTGVFVLTLFMVLKRLHVLLRQELSQ